MPLYEFLCPICGPFEERRPFREANALMHCPTCGSVAQRVYTAPNLQRLPPVVRAALQREEKSRHEPDVVRRPVGPGESVPHPQWRQSQGRPWVAGH
jgi:putative FmdB family regulatory protein